MTAAHEGERLEELAEHLGIPETTRVPGRLVGVKQELDASRQPVALRGPDRAAPEASGAGRAGGDARRVIHEAARGQPEEQLPHPGAPVAPERSGRREARA